MKFTNDTGNSILIWPYFKDSNYLVFDFYGTYDNRNVKLGTPSTYDKKSSGAMKATWTRTVTKDGVMKKDVFNSVYQPPALFHKQESYVTAKPDTNSPTPQPTLPPTTVPQPSPTPLPSTLSQ